MNCCLWRTTFGPNIFVYFFVFLCLRSSVLLLGARLTVKKDQMLLVCFFYWLNCYFLCKEMQRWKKKMLNVVKTLIIKHHLFFLIYIELYATVFLIITAIFSHLVGDSQLIRRRFSLQVRNDGGKVFVRFELHQVSGKVVKKLSMFVVYYQSCKYNYIHDMLFFLIYLMLFWGPFFKMSL